MLKVTDNPTITPIDGKATLNPLKYNYMQTKILILKI